MNQQYKDEERVGDLVKFLVRQQACIPKNRAKGSWLGCDPGQILGKAIEELGEVSDAMSKTPDDIEAILREIGDTIFALGMLADILQHNGSADSKIERDVSELGKWLSEHVQPEVLAVAHTSGLTPPQLAMRILMTLGQTNVLLPRE